MTDTQVGIDHISIRLADSQDDIEAAQRLRYKVFYEELNATPTDEMAAVRRDLNDFDSVADILVVTDDRLGEGSENIVGTYRLLRQDIAEKHGHFYTSDEFDISPLIDSGASLLELGRSCVLEPYRTRPVLQKMWGGIAEYVAEHNIGLMFGCASLPGTDVESYAAELSYLNHFHLAEEGLCPKALDSVYVDMNILPNDSYDARRTFASLPPLIKGYLRLGASIGDGAYIDKQWDSIDVCIVMPTHLVTDKYFKHYQRKTEKEIVIDDKFAEKHPSRIRETGS
ncbi:MAG: GNAT family N-acyltransferase [Pseudomonadota bacterium]